MNPPTHALPMSFAQRRMLLLHLLSGPGAAYHLPVVLRLTGDVDERALRTAVEDVANRHEPLRTYFPGTDGEPTAVLGPPPRLTVVPVAEGDLDDAVRAAASAPFDLGREPPMRAVLFVLDAHERVLLLVPHHIAADGAAMTPLLADLAEAYRARVARTTPGWSPLPFRYTDYVLWQQELLGDPADPAGVHAGQLEYWTRTLAGLPELITLPADRPRPAVASGLGAAVSVHVGQKLHRDIVALARDNDCTVHMVVHAALAVLLARLGAGTDIAIGSVVAGRTEDGLDELVGLFVNTLVLRTDLSGNPDFREVLRRVRRTDLEALAHQDLPFDRLVEALDVARSPARQPLFQVLLAFEPDHPERVDFGDVRVRRHRLDLPAAKFDLTFQLREVHDDGGAPQGIEGYLEYATDLFDASTARAAVARLGRVLDAAVAAPERPIGRIDLLSAEERAQVLAEWHATRHPLPVTTLHAEFERQARRTPDAIALVFGDTRIGYAELDERATRLAGHLAGYGVGAGSLVGVALPRSVDLVVALLAILKAGGAYLPLDPEHPPARSARILLDARPTCVLTDRAALRSSSVPILDPGDPDLARPTTWTAPALDPHHPAYVIYTSGSTGHPKGVVVPHGAIDNRLRWMQGAYPLGPADRVLHKTPVGFDVSVWELFWPLRTGAALVVAEPGEHRDPVRLWRTVRGQAITVLHFVPSMLRQFLAGDDAPARTSLRMVFASGEELPRDVVDAFHEVLPGTRLENLYGPTEAAVDVTAQPCPPGGRGPVPIGRPVWNTRARVLDADLNPCPIGVRGELYLAGVQLARGYLGGAGLTAQRFVADPHGAPGERMYRTGDLARRLPGGALAFLGRVDHQVKVRGQRVELGEVESVLLADDLVDAACATVRDGGQRLLAYVCPRPGRRRPDPAALRRLLADRLPAAMVPEVITVLDRLPVGPNGKLDRSALPEPRVVPAGGPRPRTTRQRQLAALFEEVLGVPAVGLTDDFFALGGHSLRVVRLVRRIREVTGVVIPAHEVFRAPTVEGLAHRLSGPAEHTAVPVLRAGNGGGPLFFLPPATGLSWCYRRILPYVDPVRPVYGLQTDPSWLPTSVAELAEHHLAQVRRAQPRGPYRFLGWSFGGHVAHTVAARLRAEGEEVALLVMFDSYLPLRDRVPGEAELTAEALRNLLGGHRDADLSLTPAVLDEVRHAFPPLAESDDERVAESVRTGVNNLRLLASFRPEVFDGDLTVLLAGRDEPVGVRPVEAWRGFVTGRLTVRTVDSGHHEMFGAAAEATGSALAAVLRGTEPAPSSGNNPMSRPGTARRPREEML
ncbi:non-ribosomal peptide synthetase [Actinosynnema sp. CS-041913]|uniref:non-ribosomal peptide synthetase n=1 Tax=Actinosynnema sp. CS-041913 TaxID=3239917 RepID=UPI003D90D8E0